MTQQRLLSASVRLKRIKAAHTVVWAFFVGCIFAIPVLSWLGHFLATAWIAAIVLGEVIVLVLNGWSCPLTAIAAQHTTERQANFDIYLPEWLARNNKSVFGALYFGAVCFALVLCMTCAARACT
jgi:hypothetical protein